MEFSSVPLTKRIKGLTFDTSKIYVVIFVVIKIEKKEYKFLN
jgi:hypothetical protein